MSRHLLAGGDYLSLIQYSAHYGEKFLLRPFVKSIQTIGWEFDRIVEFGAGLGWLARGLAMAFTKHYVTLDKRPWPATTYTMDLELQFHVETTRDTLMKEGDLIVMSDFLHCIEDPVRLVSSFPDWPMAILEYCPTNPEWLVSYADQIGRYGANAFTPEDFETMFLGRKTEIIECDPYIIILTDKRQE